MKLHLIRTPDYPVEHFKEVIDILRSFNGPINFISSQLEFQKEDFFFLTRDMRADDFSGFKILQKTFYIAERGMPLSWDELFSLCRYYRDALNVPPCDFVILLTERMNTLNWFSVFESDRNAFVHCADWELFTDASPAYPIAYEVMANVLRCLMKANLDNPNQSFHEPPIGCMNDLCIQKSDIILKLKTADICKDCHQHLVNNGVDDQVVNQAFHVFEGMRKQILFRSSLKRNISPGPVKLNHQRRLVFPDIGNLELKLNPLERALYVFYLIHPEGVRLNVLHDHRTELLSLYRRFSVHDDNEGIQNRISSLVDPLKNSFSEKKSTLNRKIKDLLGEELGSHYTIKGEPGSAFRVGIASNLILIEEEILN